jgi:hypothetical protein
MYSKDGQAAPPIKELSIIFDSAEDAAKAAAIRLAKPPKDPTKITEAEAAAYTGPCFKAGELGCTEIRYYYNNSVLIVVLDTTTGVQEYHYPVDTIKRVKVLS